MKHRAQSDASSISNLTFIDDNYLVAHNHSGSFDQPWNHGYGAQLHQEQTEIPCHHLLHQLPLTPVPCWKLYENQFYIDGKLYRPRYLNAPIYRTANCFTSANNSSPSQNASAVFYAPKKGASLSLSTSSIPITKQPPTNVFMPFLPPPNHDVEASFLEHRNIHHLADVQVPKHNNKGSTDMASGNAQTTLGSILQRLRQVEETQSRSNATIGTLRLEMEDALSRIQELEFSHESALREINSLLQRFGEQMAMSRRKEQENLRAAFLHLREGIKEERSTCRLLKLQNKKLMKELEEANAIAADAGEELDRERKARELMEEVCNELAREIGEDKAEVEQLKQEQAKSREMVEQELKMMRMAGLWRDDRVIRSKSLNAEQLELMDDRENASMALYELKSTLGEFVSRVGSVHSTRDEKQETTIEQARMLRQALELTMHQLADEGAPQADINNEQEKVFTPIASHTCRSNSASSVESFADGHESEGPHMYQYSDSVELQIKPHNHLLERSSNNVRRPHVASSGGELDYPVRSIMQARKPLKLHSDDDDDGAGGGGDALQKRVSDKHSNVTDRIGTLTRNKPKELDESKDPWSASDRRVPSAPMSCDRSEVHMLKHAPSYTHIVKRVHQRQSSLHLDDRDHNGHDDNHLPENLKVHSLSDEDARQGSMIYARQQNRAQHFTQAAIARVSNTNQGGDNTHPYGYGVQEGVRSVDHHHPMHLHEYGHADGACVKGEGGEEKGEFDDFYYGPVSKGGTTCLHVLGDECEDSYGTAGNAEGHNEGMVEADGSRLAGCGDEQMASINTVKEEPTYDAMVHGNGSNILSARYGGGMSGKSSTKEAPAPPIRMLVHIPSQGGAKTHNSPRNVRSSSPIKQCFWRPPRSPPSDDNVPSAPSDHNKEHGACMTAGSMMRTGALSGPGPEAEIDGGTLMDITHSSSASLDDDGVKNNSLRAELLRAREIGIEQTVHHRHSHVKSLTKGGNSKSSTPFKFSPLRRSLTHSHSR